MDEIVGQMRKVFSSRDGQEVLLWILSDCGAFDQIPETTEALTLRNWGIRLLTLIGGGRIAKENVRAFTHQLMRQQIEKTIKEEL
jgi:hypothetical protein